MISLISRRFILILAVNSQLSDGPVIYPMKTWKNGKLVIGSPNVLYVLAWGWHKINFSQLRTGIPKTGCETKNLNVG
jgi:hypothetical protein